MNENFALRTYTGRLVDLSNPTLDDIVVEDMAHHLSNINRFNGATKVEKSWSVAAHSLLVAALASDPEVYPYALLHDAHEAWCQDIISPVKKLLESFAGYDIMALIADRFDDLIYERFNLSPITPQMKAAVKKADILAYGIEAALLTNAPNGKQELRDLVAGDAMLTSIIDLAGRPEAAKEWFASAVIDLEARHSPQILMIA